MIQSWLTQQLTTERTLILLQGYKSCVAVKNTTQCNNGSDMMVLIVAINALDKMLQGQLNSVP